ncbi:23S rRNA pseudouridine(2604) synthase RluF [Aliidiomarina shirensis]|uniref:Pseudouridine synthase n=1 Tax=Aliidiomarina shirensis TaxID=1048642 RepID=A0A432WQD7_9GAMM|nr:23S rRNA pseudouridine(2604) synthase RluF [Aliidiomarina shirensis]RUO35980.1 23S rRNA pseudouridine(2604) synthase RluF [Aliidiomarina shirensis]
MPNTSETRLNKYISESGICSRREADRFIEQGNVFINGRRALMGEKVGPDDEVKVNGQLIESQNKEGFVFIALNKPVGIVSTTDSAEKANMADFVNHEKRIFPIGRLDKDSQGLIFLTSNGDLVNKILRAGNNHEKEYVVTVNKPITDDFIQGMSRGVPILGEVTKKCKVSKVSRFVFKITLVQGLNRQIRRMCEFFDYDVKKLERIRIMNIELKGLGIGEWRDLTEQELDTLLKSVAHSSSEAPPGHKKKKPAHKQKTNSGKKRGGTNSTANHHSEKPDPWGGRSKSENKSRTANGKPNARDSKPSKKPTRSLIRKAIKKKP